MTEGCKTRCFLIHTANREPRSWINICQSFLALSVNKFFFILYTHLLVWLSQLLRNRLVMIISDDRHHSALHLGTAFKYGY